MAPSFQSVQRAAATTPASGQVSRPLPSREGWDIVSIGGGCALAVQLGHNVIGVTAIEALGEFGGASVGQETAPLDE